MRFLDIFQVTAILVGIFYFGYSIGHLAGWSKAERWFWTTREKK